MMTQFFDSDKLKEIYERELYVRVINRIG